MGSREGEAVQKLTTNNTRLHMTTPRGEEVKWLPQKGRKGFARVHDNIISPSILGFDIPPKSTPTTCNGDGENVNTSATPH